MTTTNLQCLLSGQHEWACAINELRLLLVKQELSLLGVDQFPPPPGLVTVMINSEGHRYSSEFTRAISSSDGNVDKVAFLVVTHNRETYCWEGEPFISFDSGFEKGEDCYTLGFQVKRENQWQHGNYTLQQSGTYSARLGLDNYLPPSGDGYRLQGQKALPAKVVLQEL